MSLVIRDVTRDRHDTLPTKTEHCNQSDSLESYELVAAVKLMIVLHITILLSRPLLIKYGAWLRASMGIVDIA
jgi:hypothetical protein